MPEKPTRLTPEEAREDVERFDKAADTEGLPKANEYSSLGEVQAAAEMLEESAGYIPVEHREPTPQQRAVEAAQHAGEGISGLQFELGSFKETIVSIDGVPVFGGYIERPEVMQQLTNFFDAERQIAPVRLRHRDEIKKLAEEFSKRGVPWMLMPDHSPSDLKTMPSKKPDTEHSHRMLLASKPYSWTEEDLQRLKQDAQTELTKIDARREDLSQRIKQGATISFADKTESWYKDRVSAGPKTDSGVVRRWYVGDIEISELERDYLIAHGAARPVTPEERRDTEKKKGEEQIQIRLSKGKTMESPPRKEWGEPLEVRLTWGGKTRKEQRSVDIRGTAKEFLTGSFWKQAQDAGASSYSQNLMFNIKMAYKPLRALETWEDLKAFCEAITRE